MYRLFALTAIILATLCSPVAAQVRINEPAPDFTLSDSNNEIRTLSEYKGKIVVLEWTNHLCPFVKKHYKGGNMQALQKKYAGEKNDKVVWLSIISSAEGKEGYVRPYEANQIAKQNDATPNAILLDSFGKVGRLYRARTTPHMYIIDKDGILVYQGAIDNKSTSDPKDIPGAINHVQVALDELLAGKKVSLGATQPYGCSIKY
jgi:alkyl hydroperoxide reductase subunit AhpC